MYAPRTPAGAKCATTVCDVGTHNISPMTKSVINTASKQLALTSRRLNIRTECPVSMGGCEFVGSTIVLVVGVTVSAARVFV